MSKVLPSQYELDSKDAILISLICYTKYMKRYIIYLIVILNPYNDIDYEEPTLYIIEDTTTKVEIVETLGEGYEKEEPETKSQPTVLAPYYFHHLTGQYFPY